MLTSASLIHRPRIPPRLRVPKIACGKSLRVVIVPLPLQEYRKSSAAASPKANSVKIPNSGKSLITDTDFFAPPQREKSRVKKARQKKAAEWAKAKPGTVPPTEEKQCPPAASYSVPTSGGKRQSRRLRAAAPPPPPVDTDLFAASSPSSPSASPPPNSHPDPDPTASSPPRAASQIAQSAYFSTEISVTIQQNLVCRSVGAQTLVSLPCSRVAVVSLVVCKELGANDESAPLLQGSQERIATSARLLQGVPFPHPQQGALSKEAEYVDHYTPSPVSQPKASPTLPSVQRPKAIISSNLAVSPLDEMFKNSNLSSEFVIPKKAVLPDPPTPAPVQEEVAKPNESDDYIALFNEGDTPQGSERFSSVSPEPDIPDNAADQITTNPSDPQSSAVANESIEDVTVKPDVVDGQSSSRACDAKLDKLSVSVPSDEAVCPAEVRNSSVLPISDGPSQTLPQPSVTPAEVSRATGQDSGLLQPACKFVSRRIQVDDVAFDDLDRLRFESAKYEAKMVRDKKSRSMFVSHYLDKNASVGPLEERAVGLARIALVSETSCELPPMIRKVSKSLRFYVSWLEENSPLELLDDVIRSMLNDFNSHQISPLAFVARFFAMTAFNASILPYRILVPKLLIQNARMMYPLQLVAKMEEQELERRLEEVKKRRYFGPSTASQDPPQDGASKPSSEDPAAVGQASGSTPSRLGPQLWASSGGGAWNWGGGRGSHKQWRGGRGGSNSNRGPSRAAQAQSPQEQPRASQAQDSQGPQQRPRVEAPESQPQPLVPAPAAEPARQSNNSRKRKKSAYRR